MTFVMDSETFSFIQAAKREAPYAFLKQTGLHTMGADVPLRPEVEQWLRGRVEFIQAGVERCPGWFKKTLERFDNTLRLRWDFYQDHWVIERLSPTDNLYHRVGVWADTLDHKLIDALRQGDMWRTTTAEKIEAIESAAAAKRAEIDAKGRDGYAAQFDALSRRQLEDFIEVSKALEHGEELQFAGQDADFMNKIWEEKKKNPDMNEQALNPGVKPGSYKRNHEELT